MTKRHLLTLFVLLAFVYPIAAQQISVVIQGATVHIGNGQIIPKGFVVFENGKIVAVDSALRSTYKNATYINAEGKHVYPGLILLNTYLGLNEIDAVRATRDYEEAGELNTNVRALIAYNTDSKVTPTALFNGVLHMQVVPQGGLISGKSCVVNLQAKNWEDAALVEEDGMHINWPEQTKYSNKDAEQLQQIQLQQQKLTKIFTDAQLKNLNDNLKLQSLQRVLNSNAKVYFHVNTAKAIVEVLQFIKQQHILHPVLVTNEQAVLVADEISAAGVPVVLGNVHSLPTYNHSAVHAPYAAAAKLINKGVLVAIGQSGSWESRNVMFTAGTCAGYGLTHEQALQLITENAAKICGVNDVTGTLAVGKNASIIISDGDVLDMKTNHITHAFIDGVAVDLTNHQNTLYQKHAKQLGVEAK